MSSFVVGPLGPACTDWSCSQGLDPVGSAGSYQGYLLVEHGLPWPHDVSRLPALASLSALASGAGARLQAVYPRLTPGAAAGSQLRRLVCYQPARAGWVAPLSRSEAWAGPDEVPEVGGRLLHEVGPGEHRADEVVDVLVCTHGSRDACCGSRGTELFRDLVASLGHQAPGASRAGHEDGSRRPVLRPWRTSHTGGHRFAPTALVLPSATLWAWADVPLLLAVARMSGPLEDLLPRYRGCALFSSPRHQALERAVLAEVGWPLLASARRAGDGRGATVRLTTEVAGEWEAVVEEGRRVPQPECHAGPAGAGKSGTEWKVTGLRRARPV